MLKILWLFLLAPLLLLGGEFEKYLQMTDANLAFVQTPEDKRRLGFFSALYETGKQKEKPIEGVPKTLHFIWLGPKPFPEESVEKIKGWLDHHPGWTALFWSDQMVTPPDPRMQLNSLEAFPLQELTELYYRSNNFGERSQMLRYAILSKVGGVYVDHDVTCLASIEPLQEAHDFFCGLEPFGPSILSSSVNPACHLIGSAVCHPILTAAKKWLLNEWDRQEEFYPGSDPIGVYNRVQHRTFRALYQGIKEGHSRNGRKDVVFPPVHFSLADPKQGVFATHAHAGSWHKKDSESEKKIQSLFIQTIEELDKNFLLSLCLILINLGVSLLLFKLSNKKKKRAV